MLQPHIKYLRLAHLLLLAQRLLARRKTGGAPGKPAPGKADRGSIAARAALRVRLAGMRFAWRVQRGQ